MIQIFPLTLRRLSLNKRRDAKLNSKKSESQDSKTSEVHLLHDPEEGMQLYEHLSHTLKDNSGLLQIEDVDINYIVFFCKPLVLSTSQQLEEENEKAAFKHGPKGSKGRKRARKNNFDTYASLDKIKKKTADTAGTLQSKTVGVQEYLLQS
jgi:hypothetical protein